MNIYESNVVLDSYSWSEAFNDPDMMCVGLKGLNDNQNKAHFSLWCIMDAPLIIGADVRNVDNNSIEVMTNTIAIMVDQDPLAVQGKRIQSANDQHVIVKPLQNGSVAVLFFNKANQTQSIQYNMKNVTQYIQVQNEAVWNNATSYNWVEAWSNTSGNTTNALVGANMGAYAAFLYIVTPQQ